MRYRILFDWRRHLFSDSRVWIARNKILNGLEKLGFSVKTFMYVSTRGEEIRDLHYAISPEVQEKLLSLKPEFKEELEEQYKKKCTIYDFLVERVISYVRSLEEISEEIININRQEYWNRLEMLGLREEDIKPVIDKLAEKGITSKYKGIFSRELPFVIKDEEGYKYELKKMLIEPVLRYLFEEKPEKIEKKNRVPPDLVSKDELFMLFNELGEFERKLRDFISRKLGKNLKRCRNEDLKKRLEKRRKEDELILGYIRYPLIDYATFDEYIILITSNWDEFKKYFDNEIDKATIPLKTINVLLRRPLAHFRTPSKEGIRRAREEMIKFLKMIEEK